MTYFGQMKLRFKAWVLVALLALSAHFGVQVSRVAPARAAAAIVFCDHFCKQAAGVQERAVEKRVARIPIRSTAKPQFINPDSPRAESPQYSSLFQRPPPTALSFRL